MLTRNRTYPDADETVDVLIVGAGGAGLAAAIEAAELGNAGKRPIRVVVLEKNAAPGGSTSWSVGSVSASQTPHQRAQGIVDSPQAHWEDMPGFAGDLAWRDNDGLRRVLCDAMPETFQWLLDSGVRFMGPMPEPPHRVPRMHNVLPNSRSFIYHLTRRALKAGAEIRTAARVVELVLVGGEVKGVLVERGGVTKRIDSRGGVILAAGDFTNSPELKARFMGGRQAKVAAVNPTATGDGQQIAERCGARIVNGDLAQGPELRFIAPEAENFVRRLPPWRSLAALMQWSTKHLPDVVLRPFLMKFLTTALAPSIALFADGAVLVSERGERLDAVADQLALRLAEVSGGLGYIVMDARTAARYCAWPHFISTAPGVAYAYLADYRRNRPDVYHEATSIGALAAKIGMDPTMLARSVDPRATLIEQSQAPNAAPNAVTNAVTNAVPNVAHSERPDVGPSVTAGVEAHAARSPSSGAAAYIALGPVRSVFVHAEGGLMVDDRHRVLDSEDKPIAGLLAAGSTGQGGLLLKGHGHHLAWAFASGRRAGRFAALAAAHAAHERTAAPTGETGVSAVAGSVQKVRE